ncbi:helix-turn-helix transcriptional regulator [Tumidithrix elongata RA019]|uniref:Helix-turn-helix transcriptional regulator n=1 Tax=Tumidithrix elongata BACA0141 TaxID=2716417 RepID=A0AAW9Q248_9CYAN|nr:helix-turn-helix transcriptional regulator [Tumidithrix elongata RA019]
MTIADELTYTINPEPLQDWIRDQLSRTTQNKLAKEMAISRPILSEILQGKSKFKGSTIKAFAKKQGLSAERLLQQLGAEVVSEYSDTPALGYNLAHIPVYDILAGAGNGSYAGDIVQILGFERSWLRSEFGAVESLEGVRVSGDSMEPTLKSGDVVLVNRSDHAPKDGIYVLRIEHDLFVKRLSRLPSNKIEVISDNPSYSNYTIDLSNPPTDFQIIGRVVMKCQKL